jgi:mRNA interferase MazF
VGAEIAKSRPALVVSSDNVGVLPLKVIVPVTGWQTAFTKFPWMVMIDPKNENGLSKTSAADTFQVRSLSENRFLQKLGDLDAVTMKKVELALGLVLEINL